jgi:3-oxoacyl-(acyl-carrier-protein) synthase
VTGNPLAAAGPFQIISCALSLVEQILPPTANYQTPDPDCDLDVIPNRARKAQLSRALVNVRGLGGSASAMVLERVESS